MDDQVQTLVSSLWRHPPNSRLLIGISGIPGSGKTSLAKHLVDSVNARSIKDSPSTLPPAIGVSMDGFHLSRAQLDVMPDPVEAHRRRGAAFTFDGDGFVYLVRRLKRDVQKGDVVKAPTFDHAVKDPVADEVVIRPEHRFVVVEGNYVALDVEPWKQAASMFDVLVFVEVDEDVARRRLVNRHVQAGIVKNEAEALERAEGNDLINGRGLLAKRYAGSDVQFETVVSREDEAWVEEVE